MSDRERRERRRRRTREHRLRARVASVLREAALGFVGDVWRDLRHFDDPPGLHKALNFGWCDEVAEIARARLRRLGITACTVQDDDDLIQSTDDLFRDGPCTHTWLWVAGRHHDTEALTGVRRWLHLPHFARWRAGGADMAPVREQGDEHTAFEREAKFLRTFYSQVFTEMVA